jgi:hypothetical protein
MVASALQSRIAYLTRSGDIHRKPRVLPSPDAGVSNRAALVANKNGVRFRGRLCPFAVPELELHLHLELQNGKKGGFPRSRLKSG